ncbi:cytochrome c maturation protein CcmE [Bacillus dakarensis]|uniref:cytochrome c maturation protein CcmE n=1 Tax=Robertmurraya dakarensis TaxID=1926278 RepID=UPI00098171C7|nr:cytochrome c maturation protein CcmE [Bacillus dakarensis]
MSKNKKILTGLILGAAALMIMMFSSMPSAGSKEITISDIVDNRDQYKGDYIMTQGLLNKDSVQWDADKIELEFSIYDENDVTLPVFHKGIKPDNFSDDVIVIVEGFVNEEGVFEAEKVQTKCPSKYEGEDMENYDVETHQELLND